MKSKASIYASLAVFVLFIFGLALWGVLQGDKAVSRAERRKLANLPAASVSDVLNGSWSKSFDSYTADQFPARDGFRTINALVRTMLLGQKDIGGLYMQGPVVFKSDYPLQPKNIERFIKKTNSVYTDYIKGKAENYYAAVIPDKSYFDSSDRLKTDAGEVARRFAAGLEGAKYIDIFPGLNLESYYKTDTHWSQEKLFDTMGILGAEMGFSPPNQGDYSQKSLEPFYGVYWGQSALNPQPDRLVYMTSKWTESAVVENMDKPDFKSVYDLEAFSGMDGYELFLSGGTPFTKITSPSSQGEKELIIFRDSFGSSIAPLFLEEYRSVTLVDLRYFSSSLIPQYLDFTAKDVLVLYSSLILNSNIQLK